VTWTAATGAILVFVGISGFFVLANPYITPAASSGGADGEALSDDMEIEVLAFQWGWEFSYPDSDVTTRDRLVIPRDTDVRFSLRSTDVIHSTYIPQPGVKQDIFPGQTTVARTNATETGEYRLYCAELCGTGHSRMHATVSVVNQSEYDDWLAQREAGLDGEANATASPEANATGTAAPTATPA
jgi:cytochrome c oxidase subunit 2